MNLGIIGAGATGLTAAWDAVRAGHQVTVLEAADELGGLAASLDVGGVPLERYYHHIFRSDKAMIALIEELGLGDALRFHRPTTGIYRGGKLIDFTTPLDMLRFPEFGPVDAVRFAGSSAVLKAVRNGGDRYNDLTALAWLRKWAGRKATAAIWEPLLRGKFGDRAEQVSMAWLWARIHCRTFELGYVDGGFERVYAALRDGIEEHGGKVEFGKAVQSIRQDGAEEAVVTCADGSSYAFDRLIVTTPQPAFAKAAGLPDDSAVWKNQYLGATCFVLELDRSVIPYYWLNINEPDFPFLAVVEHTKMIDPSVYGGRHILYVGNYVEREDRRFTTDPGQLLDEFVPYLKRINPAFDRSWIQTWHFSKAGFAQPVVTPEYRALIPAHETPMSRVTLATMAQIYPQDRGQSYSVAMAREVTAALGLNA